MKNKRKIILGTLFTLLILTLFGCGVNKRFSFVNAPVLTTKETVAAKMMSGYAANTVADMAVEEVALANGADYGAYEKKIIRTIDIVAESKEFDNALVYLKTQVNNNSGIIDNSYVDSGNMASDVSYRKNAHFSVRIPAEKANIFLKNVKSELNVTFEQESIRDVTDAYDDTESRKETLLIEEEKLNELLKKAKNIDDIIRIEEKLSEVRRDLQNIDGRLKRYDKQIDYTTINVTINEVTNLTDFVPKEDISRENLIKQLNKNLEATKRFVVNVCVFLFVHIPAICLILIVIIVFLLIVLIVRAATKPRDKKVEVKEKKKRVKKVKTKGKNVVKEEKNTENNNEQAS